MDDSLRPVGKYCNLQNNPVPRHIQNICTGKELAGTNASEEEEGGRVGQESGCEEALRDGWGAHCLA